MNSQSLWVIDKDNLAEAVEYLGLQYPVSISPTGQEYVGKYHGIGHYGPETAGAPTDEPTHFVQIEGSLSSWWASKVAWHELTHAQQAERYMPEAEVDEYGVPRWKAGLRTMTRLYAKEARATNGFSNGSHTPSYSYTNISFEREANDNMKHADEVAILRTKPGEVIVWRVDKIRKSNGETETFYVKSAYKSAAEDYVKDTYGPTIVADKWRYEYVVTPTDRPVKR